MVVVARCNRFVKLLGNLVWVVMITWWIIGGLHQVAQQNSLSIMVLPVKYDKR